ncbi:hypothetical protein CDO52_12405 [Nocardiopsis gilva YIM 90087]|uniref:Thioredoxin domain-containing protein n=1 Tax=Nocardiopsis gilva YIM 90087 TaxID=1235441 RepID=A0A223S5T2_9ACTN|nr:redoxin domain-containing protein [Nocardiopsis gilva]ASU83480.1 hypothetical protein CDO52_12405 [Nocardiopsis gilva YIM 90087]
MSTESVLAVLWVVVSFNLLLTLRLASKMRKGVPPPASASPEVPSVPTGAAAPPFEATTLDGRPFSLREYENRAVTFVFFYHGCATCRSHFPTISRLFAIAQRANSELVLVTYDEQKDSRPATEEMVKEFRIPAKVLFVPLGHELEKTYNPRKATPFFIHIENGIVRRNGGLGGDEWDQLVAEWHAKAEAGRRLIRKFA